MHPFIRPGDWVTIHPPGEKGGGDVRVGDCVIFRDRGRRWLIHRVIGTAGGPGEILTKGDARLRPDDPARREAIAGRVTAVERSGSGTIYRLDRPSSRFLNRLIALLSRLEAAVFSRGNSAWTAGFPRILVRLVKSPRWLLTRIFFP